MFPAVLISSKDVNISTNKIKEAAKTAAEQIYQAYSVKN